MECNIDVSFEQGEMKWNGREKYLYVPALDTDNPQI